MILFWLVAAFLFLLCFGYACYGLGFRDGETNARLRASRPMRRRSS